jgi:phosphoribosylformylglycinamidine (FGAM) synthase PurS component
LSDDVDPKRIDEMCKKLLVNEIIEDYKVEIS